MARKQRPKTGEARKTRQPFAIDKLPSSWRDQIISWRAKWLTWEQIEEETTKFEWDKLPDDISAALFADRRIPHSTLHRWYDVQVEQKLEEIETERQASLQIAERFAAAGYKNLDESVTNAIADVVFSHAKDAADPERFRKTLTQLGRLLQRSRQLDIASKRVDVESKKLDMLATKVLGLKEQVAGKKKVSQEELAQKLDEIYDIARPNA